MVTREAGGNSGAASTLLSISKTYQQSVSFLPNLKGAAKCTVEGYYITPENYETIQLILRERFGDPFTIKQMLYDELHSIKASEEIWNEHLRRLKEFLGNRQFKRIRGPDKYGTDHWEKITTIGLCWNVQKKELDSKWSVSKLRECLQTIVRWEETIGNVRKTKVTATEVKGYDHSKRY